jgi:hypothetical protein
LPLEFNGLYIIVKRRLIGMDEYPEIRWGGAVFIFTPYTEGSKREGSHGLS